MNRTVYINARFLTQQITGVQQFAFEICRYLQCGEIEFVLLTPKGCVVPPSLSHLSHKEVGNNRGYVWEQIELPSFLKKQGIPLLLNFCNTAPIWYINQWVTIHDLAFMHHPEWFSKSFFRVYRFLIPRIAKRSKRVFTVSETIRKQLVTLLHVPDTKIELLHNGIHHELLLEPRGDSASRKKNILTVSSINPRKNLHTLIQAFSLVGLDGYTLMVVGAKNEVFGKQSFATLPNVTFTGYVSNKELAGLYREASLFVSLSYDEGFGIPVLEALYCGCPVLLSDIDVYRECFGDVAEFTSPFDVQQAAAAIRKAIQHPPVAMGIEGLLRQYNYADSAKKLMKLLRETPEKM
ncbi:MAG: glycosyltransferase family 1 protein [Bacteroidota bacterium]